MLEITISAKAVGPESASKLKQSLSEDRDKHGAALEKDCASGRPARL